MVKPLCKIAQETGDVPLECLFQCQRRCVETRNQEKLDQELGFDEVRETSPQVESVKELPTCR